MGNEKKGVSGTKEWAASNVNIQSGCDHDCLYCYAKASAVRFDRLPKGGWTKPELNEKAVEKGYGKRKGTIMFPTAHDITPGNRKHSINTLRKMCAAGNRVLIVSKPRISCIAPLCLGLEPYKDQVLFRFTIGSGNSQVLAFWEPGAPDFVDRLDSLQHAFDEGFQTSVSMEPLLDVEEDDIVAHVELLTPYITDAIWLGKANRLRERLKRNGYGANKSVMEAAATLEESQSDERIVSLYERLKGHPKVKWKESIKKVVGLAVPTEAGLDI